MCLGALAFDEESILTRHATLVACDECDALQSVPPIPPGGSARCLCCGARLLSNPRGGLDVPLALTLAAFVLYLLANYFPLLELDIQGITHATTFTGAALAMIDDDKVLLGVTVWGTSVLAPGLIIGINLYVLLAARLLRPWPLLRFLLTWLSRLRPWGMLDVFMLGILVAMVKLGDMAEIIIGPGLYAFVPLMLLTIAAGVALEPRLLWDRLERIR